MILWNCLVEIPENLELQLLIKLFIPNICSMPNKSELLVHGCCFEGSCQLKANSQVSWEVCFCHYGAQHNRKTGYLVYVDFVPRNI